VRETQENKDITQHSRLTQNSHILSTEYEDTRQAHTTLRKRKDKKPRDQIEETTQDREEGVQSIKIEEVEEIDKERKKEEIEEEIIELERDSKGRLIRKQKQKEMEKQIDTEEEEETIKKIRKTLIPKRSNIGRDEIQLEEIEEFEITKNQLLPSMVLNVSSQRNQVIPLDHTIEQAPSKPESEKAKYTLDTVIALTEQMTSVHEKEIDQVVSIKPIERKASISISSIEPYSTMETTAHISTDEFSGSFKATSYEAIPSVITKESLLISETLTHDESVSNLTLTTPETSRKADVQVTVQEATTIRETIVNQSEIPTEDFITPLSVKAEDIVLPQISLSVYEIQEGLVENKLEPTKTVLTKPRVNINAIEPLMVEEIHSEDKPGKYYPELIVPTEVATKSIISQRQRVTEEMNAPEKEGAYIPGRLPPSQTAQIEISYGNETAVIRHDLVQEREGEYIPERKVDSFEVTPNITLLEGVTISMIDTQQKEHDLTIEESKQVTADLNVVEIMSAVTMETMTSEKEQDYHPEEKPTTKLAVTSISPLEIGSITDTIVQESEGTYNVDEKPFEVLAETSVRPEEHILISQVQTADYPADLKDILKYVTESGVVSIQLTEAKTVLETLIHDRETSMKEDAKPEIHTIETIYDAIRGIEISQTTFGEKEAELKIFEMPESHRGKTVPTHPMISLEVQETQPENNLGKVMKEAVSTATAQIETVSLQETIVDETIAAEDVAPTRKDKIPETMTAIISMNQIESLHTTMIVTDEKETEYLDITDVKSAFANTEYMTQVAPIYEQIRIESPTEEYLAVDKPVSGKAYLSHVPIETISIVIQETAEKEDVYKTDIKPEEKMANINLTDMRPGASVLEIIPHDFENIYTPDTEPQTHMVESSITGHTIASKTEILVEQSAGKISSDLPKLGKAIVQQEALEELIVTETNVGEAERTRDEDASPVKQNAALQVCAQSENLTITEVTTVLKEEELLMKKLPDKQKVVLDITESHEIAETQEMILASNISALKEEKPHQESVTQLQSGLDVVQQMEISISEKESLLETDVKPDIKKVDITFQEGESLTIEITHPEDKEDILGEKQTPKTAEAIIDVVTQNIASTFEIISGVVPTELSTKPIQDARPKATLLPFEIAVAEEVQTRETEKPFPHMLVPEKKANFEFVMGEVLVVSSVTTGDKESMLAEMEKPQSKSATFDIPTYTVAEAAEITATDNVSELIREETISAMAMTEHITHHSIITSEMSTGDSEQRMLDFVKPDKKRVGISFEEETSITVTETIASDKEREYLKKPDIPGEKINTSFDAHKIAELTEVTPAIYPGDLNVKTPETAAAKEEHLPFESIVQSETIATETEIEFQDKQTKTDTAQISIAEIISATMSTEILGEKEDILQIPEKPIEKKAEIQFAGHIIAEKNEITPNSSTGELMETKPTSISATLSNIPLEAIVAMETQPTEMETILKKDKIPSMVQADLSMMMEQSVEISSIILEDKETEYKPKEIPKTRTAEKALIETHGVAETTIQIANFSTGEIATGETPLIAVAVPDHIMFNPLVESQLVIQEGEEQFTPALMPENKIVNIDMEESKVIASIKHITPADKESTYIIEEQPRQYAASFDIDATHSIAETTAVAIEHSVGKVTIKKPDVKTVSPTHEVYQSLLVTEDMIQDQEKPFKGKFTPEMHKIELAVEEGKHVTSVTEIKIADKEAPLETLQEDKSHLALSVIVPGYEVAERSEIITSSSIGKMNEITVPTKVTALIDQKPFETVQFSEQTLVEKEIDRIQETPLIKTKAHVILDENRFVAITESINAQDNEEEFATKKLRLEAANLLMEGKEVAERTEINLREELGELPSAMKPIVCEAHKTQSTLEGIDVSEMVPQEQGAIFIDKFKPDKRSAEISFVEGKSITVDHILTQDKEETMNIPKYEESMARIKLAKLGMDIAQKAQIFIEQNTEPIKSFEKIQAEAHIKQDTFQPIIVHEVPSAESERTFDKYPKIIFSTAMPTFEEGHGVFITEITSAEVEASLEEKRHEISRTAVDTIVTEHDMIETIMVESRVDVPEQPSDYISTPQIATSARDTFESIIVNENIVEESEKTFDDLFKPATQKANIDITELKPLQISETIIEDKEGMLNIVSKRTEVKATSDIDLFQTVEGSFVESIQNTRELQEEKPLSSQATIIQTTVESIVKSETTPAEREDIFESKLQPEGQKGKPQFESLTTVVITETASNEIEDILPEAVTPKQHQAQLKLTGRETAEILQIVTANTTEDFAKSKLYEQRGKPGLEELSSLTVSEIISNEVENLLVSKVIPKDSKADFNISGREVAETIEITTLSETNELAIGGPEKQKGNQQINELIPLTISQIISNEAEETLVSAELPTGKTAQSNLFGRDIAETTLVLTMTNAEELIPKKETEKQKGKPSLEEFIPLIVSQTESQETENILDSLNIPTERTAQTSLYGRDIAETTEITTALSLNKFVELQKPEIQKGKPNLEELLSLSITQTISSEAEALLPSSEMPTEKMAQTNLSGRDVAETSQVLTMMSTEELSNQISPDERKGKVQVEELSSLTISQILSHETEETFESSIAPNRFTAVPTMSGREIAEISQMLIVTNAEELPKPKSPTKQKGKPQLDEFSSLLVSQVISTETEAQLPSLKKLEEKTAIPCFLGREIAQKSEIIPAATVEQIPELKEKNDQKGKLSIEQMSSVTVSEVISTDTEQELPRSEIPKQQKALPKLSSIEVAEMSEILTVSNAEELARSQIPEEQTGKPNLEELMPLSIFEVSYNETEKELLTSHEPTKQIAEKTMLGMRVAEKSQVFASLTTEEMTESVKPLIKKLTPEQIPFESIQQIESIIHENESSFLPDKKTPSTTAEVSFDVSEGVEIIQVIATEKETKEVVKSLGEAAKQTAEQKMQSIHVAEKSQIITSSTTGEMMAFIKPEIKKIIPEQIPYVSIQQIESIPHESEHLLLPDKKISSKKADILFRVSEGVEVFQVTATEKEAKEIIKSLEEASQQIAEQKMLSMGVAEQSQVIASSTTENMTESVKPEIKKIIPEQIPFESIQQTESISHERESSIVSEKDIAIATADITFRVSEGVEVIQVTATEKETKNIIESLEKATKQIAEQIIPTMRVAEQSQTITSSTTKEMVESTKPETKRIIPEQIPFESIQLIESIPHESERSLLLDKKVPTTMADVSFRVSEGVEVIQITATEKEIKEIVKKEEEAIKQTAEQNILGIRVAEQSQVIASSTTKEIIEFGKPEIKTIIPEQIPFESIQQTESIPNESEYTLLPDKKIPSTKADVSFRVSEGVEVIQVTATEEETKEVVKSVKEVTKQVAEQGMLSMSVAEKTQIVTSSTTEEIKESSKPDVKKIIPEQIPFESLLQTESILHERESLLLPDKKTPSTKADVSFCISEGVKVIQVTATEEETKEVTKSVEEATKQVAEQSMLSMPVAEKTQVEASSTIQEIIESSKPEEKKVIPEQIPFESIQQIEAIPHEREHLLLPDEKTPSTIADVSFRVSEGVEVIQVTTTEKETKEIIKGLEETTKQVAEQSMLTMPVAQKSQMIASSTTEEMMESTKPETKRIIPEQIPFESIQQIESIPHESERSLLPDKETSTATADITFRVAEGIKVIQITATEKEIKEVVKEETTKQIADQSMLGMLVVEQCQVVTSSTTEEMTEPIKPEIKKIIPEQILFESIQQIESIPHERESLLLPDKKTPSTKADVSFRVSEGVEVIQVTSTEKEIKEVAKSVEEATKQVAEQSLLSMSVAEKTQVVPSSTTEEIRESSKPEVKKIIPEQIPFESIQQTESILHERESLLLPDKKTPSMKADVSFRISEGIEIIQVTAAEEETKEDVKSMEEANKQVADQSMSSISVAEKIEVFTSSTTEEIKESSKPEVKKIIPEQIPFESIQQTESIPHESERLLLSDKKTPITKAEVSFRVSEGVEVIQVTATEDETKEVVKSVEEITKQVAEQSMLSMSVAEKTQVVPSSTTEEIRESSKPEIKKIIPEQIPFESILQIESILHEKESLLLPDKKTPSTKADISFRVSESVKVIQVTATEEETKDVTKSVEEATKQVAEQSMLSMPVAQKSQVITSSETEEIIVSAKPEEKKIIPEQIPFESVQQTESILHEKACLLLPEKKIPSTKADVSFCISEGVKVIQVTATEEETKDVVKSVEEAIKQVAEQSMLSMPVAEKTQVEASLTIQEIIESSKPEEKKVIPEQIPFESILQTESILHERESLLLPDKKTPSSKADVSFRVSEGVKVIQVTATEEEIKDVVKSIEEATKQVAEQSMLSMPVAQKSQVIMSSETEEIIVSAKPEEKKIIPEQIPFEGIQQIEPISHESERLLVPDKEMTSAKADVSFRISEGVEVIQVIATEKEIKEDVKSSEEVTKQIADQSMLSMAVAEKSHVIASSSTKEMMEFVKPDVKKITAKQIPFESVQQIETIPHESEHSIIVEKVIASASAEVSFRISEGVEVTQITPTEKETKEVVKGLAKEKIAQADIIERKVALKTEIHPENVVSEFSVPKPDSKTAHDVKDEKQSIIVTELQHITEIESNLSEPVIPIVPKIASTSFEADYLEKILGKYYMYRKVT